MFAEDVSSHSASTIHPEIISEISRASYYGGSSRWATGVLLHIMHHNNINNNYFFTNNNENREMTVRIAVFLCFRL